MCSYPQPLACTAVAYCAVAITCTTASDSRCTSCVSGRTRVAGGVGVADVCSMAYQTLATFGGWTFYKVFMTNGLTMSDNNAYNLCAGKGLRIPCAGASGCTYNGDGRCVLTSETGCGMPMYTISQNICGSGVYPSNCAATQNLFTYMGNVWSGGSTCGALPGSWCVSGTSYTASGSNYAVVCVP